MYPASGTKLTVGEQPLPFFKVQEDRIDFNFSVNEEEAMYLYFMQKRIESFCNAQESVGFLPADENTLIRFTAWLKEKTNVQLSPEQTNLDLIVTALWKRVTVLVQAELIVAGNAGNIAAEQDFQKQSDFGSLVYNLQGLVGKCFTGRQLHLLRMCARDVSKMYGPKEG